jgi:hypothetical protein
MVFLFTFLVLARFILVATHDWIDVPRLHLDNAIAHQIIDPTSLARR